jgi:hypothetical protein
VIPAFSWLQLPGLNRCPPYQVQCQLPLIAVASLVIKSYSWLVDKATFIIFEPKSTKIVSNIETTNTFLWKRNHPCASLFISLNLNKYVVFISIRFFCCAFLWFCRLSAMLFWFSIFLWCSIDFSSWCGVLFAFPSCCGDRFIELTDHFRSITYSHNA